MRLLDDVRLIGSEILAPPIVSMFECSIRDQSIEHMASRLFFANLVFNTVTVVGQAPKLEQLAQQLSSLIIASFFTYVTSAS